MGFRFQRRIDLGNGWGVNASGSGASMSYRSRHGSLGSKGFSLRTGVPGLSYRQSWGENAGGVALVVVAIMAAVGVIAVALKILAYILPILWQCLRWVVLTIYDLCLYGAQKFKQWRTSSLGAP
jgi:hypothetical protein